jgi:hypothetical protein
MAERVRELVQWASFLLSARCGRSSLYSASRFLSFRARSFLCRKCFLDRTLQSRFCGFALPCRLPLPSWTEFWTQLDADSVRSGHSWTLRQKSPVLRSLPTKSCLRNRNWLDCLARSIGFSMVFSVAVYAGWHPFIPDSILPSMRRFGRRTGADQFLLGHVSVQTTEKYLGYKQRFRHAVNDRLGIEPVA